MADRFSLLGLRGHNSTTATPGPTIQNQLPQVSNQPPMVAPSIADRVLGRGEYMQEFNKRRGEIIRNVRKERRDIREKWRKQKKQYKEKIEEGDKKTFYSLGVKKSKRPTRAGLDEKQQKKLFKYSMDKAQKEIGEGERAELRQLKKVRDMRVKKMRKSLRDELFKAQRMAA